MNNVQNHRRIVEDCIASNSFDHQQLAANKVFEQFKANSRAVVVAAEMQSGKSGIALVLGCLQRLSLPDEQLVDRKYLKDTLYLVTMADLALQEQAQKDLAPCKNVVVSNFSNFETALRTDFRYHPPKLIIIDECHYGSSSDSIRYDRIFNYLERDNQHCNVAFVSATPFSALYAASADSILRHNFNTSLVFHKTSDEYLGVRQMHLNNQIVKLAEDQRDFCEESLLRQRFIRQFKEKEGTGWSLIRVPSSQAKLAQQILLDNGIEPEQIYIIGQKLVGLEDNELCSIDEFKREYETAQLFDEKLIAITVAGFRAGVNFGPDMKNSLINTWDSTISNIAAVVQANIGRACGYHSNTQAKHYTNLEAVRAYSEMLDFLESRDDSRDFNGLDECFDRICEQYEIRGFDRGTSVSAQTEYCQTKKLDDSKTYFTKQYVVVPAKLFDSTYDFSIHTQDSEILKAISLIRQELLADEGPYRKSHRALRGEHQNWIKAQWVNGATYDDGTQSCAKARAIRFATQLNAGESLEFNQIVNPGGGETTADKRVMASVFSIYNLSSRQDILKRAMDSDDMEDICQALDIEYDDTVIMLYQRGEFSQSLTDTKVLESTQLQSSRIKHQSVF